MRKFTALTISLLLGAMAATAAVAERSPVAANPLTGKLNILTADFPSPPLGKELKRRPSKVAIYEYDSNPLGDRSPFLLVHGLHGETFANFRWEKVIRKFTSDEQFANQYKVYLLRYDTAAQLDVTVPQFRAALSKLYQAAQRRQITIMALSMGGNLVYESMLDKPTDSMVKLVFTLGTPFRGSPLFCADWVKYSMYKNLCFPWTRVDHNIAYEFYFAHNRNLQQDLRWDDVDKSVPNVGKFSSRLPLGPKGDLNVATTENTRLRALEHQPFDKKKLIAYGGYLLNPYMLPESARFVETTVMAPYTLFSVKFPAHLGREHPVLKLLNKQISSTVPSDTIAERAGTRFIYQLNDGITPVPSALFLPDQVCTEAFRESDLSHIRNATDVKIARLFRNADHLTFIDGYRPLRSSPEIRDELNPDEPPKQIFDWMLSDLRSTQDKNKLAEEDEALPLVHTSPD